MCNFLKIGKPLPEKLKPKSTREISIGDISTLLYHKFPGVPVYLSDSVYKLCGLDDINAFLAQDQTNKMGYMAEEFDCDNFSYRLMGQFSVPDWSGLAFGLVWTDLHALNCVIDQNEDFWFVEPQSDALKPALEPWQGTTIRFIII